MRRAAMSTSPARGVRKCRNMQASEWLQSAAPCLIQEIAVLHCGLDVTAKGRAVCVLARHEVDSACQVTYCMLIWRILCT